MPQIKSSFILNSNQPNFTRDKFNTLLEMSKVTNNVMDTGHISYCTETGRHYIFRGDLEKNSSTGYFRELTFQDALEVESKSDLFNYNASLISQMPLGKLVYCKEDGLIYYNYYPQHNNTTGHFNLLVDLQSSNYINKTDDEWIDIKRDVLDLKNAGMVSYDTPSDMKNESTDNLKLMKEGQLAYCKSIDNHYYLPDYYMDGVNDGYFGYFRTVCDKNSVEPIITQPSLKASVEYNESDYNESGWGLFVRDGKNILLITDKSEKPNIKAVRIEADRGLINYKYFPYHEGPTEIDYIGTSTLISDMYGKDDNDVMGDNLYYISTKVSGETPIPTDINGIERKDLQWDRSKAINSNHVIVNKTKPWKATTGKGLIEQPLIPWEEEMIGYAKLLPTCKQQQQFEIPSGRELKGLYIKGLSGYVDDSSHWRRSGNIYTYKEGPRGEVELKIVF